MCVCVKSFFFKQVFSEAVLDMCRIKNVCFRQQQKRTKVGDYFQAGWIQTWNLSQAPQAYLCKILLVRVKYLAKHMLFLLQCGLVCVQILGVELTSVTLHYK